MSKVHLKDCRFGTCVCSFVALLHSQVWITPCAEFFSVEFDRILSRFFIGKFYYLSNVVLSNRFLSMYLSYILNVDCFFVYLTDYTQVCIPWNFEPPETKVFCTSIHWYAQKLLILTEFISLCETCGCCGEKALWNRFCVAASSGNGSCGVDVRYGSSNFHFVRAPPSLSNIVSFLPNDSLYFCQPLVHLKSWSLWAAPFWDSRIFIRFLSYERVTRGR